MNLGPLKTRLFPTFGVSQEIGIMDAELFKTFAFHGGVVLLKTIVMSPLTGFNRMKNQTFANQEDLALGKDVKAVNFNDPTVERIRRAHQNDLENIIPFILVGGLYLTTQPSLATAQILFRTFTAARLTHSIAYLGSVRQPVRGLAFAAGLAVNVFMAFSVIKHYLGHF